MHTAQQNRREHLEYEEAIDVLAPHFREKTGTAARRKAAEEFLQEEEVKSGIILGSDTKVRFWHQTFQEYLVADILALDERMRQRILFREGKLYDPLWRETVLLLAGALKGHRLTKSVDQLFKKMLQGAGDRGLLGHVCCFNLMTSLLQDLKAWTYTLPPELEKSYLGTRGQAACIFTKDAGDIPFAERLDAAEAIGRAGDPRLRQPQDRDYWVSLPACKFVMGEGKDDDEPRHEVELDTFLMGRFPVTVYEYGLFLEGSGHRAPYDWEEQRAHSNRPVVRVSWHDATAYCLWAGVRLPTEAEWERAARGSEGRRFAWGDDEPSPERANYGLKIGAPSPVGLFPQGATPAPEGIADLTGNVWEWTSDWYDSVYYRESEKRNPQGPVSGEFKCLRGGSWDISSSLRAAVRPGLQPGVRGGSVGFRCVREVFP
jgi:formylglycine-generating enzyme required for sulfatase activity